MNQKLFIIFKIKLLVKLVQISSASVRFDFLIGFEYPSNIYFLIFFGISDKKEIENII